MAKKEITNINSEISELGEIYEDRQKSIIIGLTGRTGSGCTTIAKLLSGETNIIDILPEVEYCRFDDRTEKLSYKIVKNFVKQNWQDSYYIKVSNLLTDR
jgi:uridine kinase